MIIKKSQIGRASQWKYGK